MRTWKGIPFLAKAAVLGVGALVAACAAGTPELPPPRPLIVHSGVRVRADAERLGSINQWVQEENDSISLDPSFWIITVFNERPTLPWEGLDVSTGLDTARVSLEGRVPEAQLPYMIYAHLHLMARSDRRQKWLPEALEAEGYDLEKAILRRVSDSWLLGRSIFDATPYEVLDEIVYSNEHGYLDALVFTARPDEFPEAREAWIEANPEGLEEYRTWFEETFGRPPPGLRAQSSSSR